MIFFASLIVASRYAMARVKVRFRGLKAGRLGVGVETTRAARTQPRDFLGLNSEGLRVRASLDWYFFGFK